MFGRAGPCHEPGGPRPRRRACRRNRARALRLLARAGRVGHLQVVVERVQHRPQRRDRHVEILEIGERAVGIVVERGQHDARREAELERLRDDHERARAAAVRAITARQLSCLIIERFGSARGAN